MRPQYVLDLVRVPNTVVRCPTSALVCYTQCVYRNVCFTLGGRKTRPKTLILVSQSPAPTFVTIKPHGPVGKSCKSSEFRAAKPWRTSVTRNTKLVICGVLASVLQSSLALDYEPRFILLALIFLSRTFSASSVTWSQCQELPRVQIATSSHFV